MYQEKHAKAVVSNSPRLVYFVIGLMNSLLTGPMGKWSFFGEFKL